MKAIPPGERPRIPNMFDPLSQGESCTHSTLFVFKLRCFCEINCVKDIRDTKEIHILSFVLFFSPGSFTQVDIDLKYEIAGSMQERQ